MRIAGLWPASTRAINCQIAAFCVRDSVVQRRKAVSPTALAFTTAAKDCRCSVTSLTAVSFIRPENFSYVFISVGEFLTLTFCSNKTTTHIFQDFGIEKESRGFWPTVSLAATVLFTNSVTSLIISCVTFYSW
jgi:hypothetical protein